MTKSLRKVFDRNLKNTDSRLNPEEFCYRKLEKSSFYHAETVVLLDYSIKISNVREEIYNIMFDRYQ